MDHCRVSIELNKWMSEQWDCTCDDDTPEDKCPGCVANDPDYFDEE